MKQVFAIYSGKDFKQYLMISEIHYVKELCQSFGKITVELVEIPLSHYKIAFGK